MMREGSGAPPGERRGAGRWIGGVLVPLVLALGCGYRLVDESAVFGPDVRVIQLEPITNTTTEIGFEAMLTDALQEEFVRRGVLIPQYTRDPEQAGLSLEGVVLEAEVVPTAFSSVTLTLEDQIQIRLSVTVARMQSADTVMSLPSLFYAERFLASADPQVYESNKEQALRRIASRAASQIHDVLFQQPF